MFKDILVQIDSTAASLRRLDVAASLAERSETHLTGLHVNWLQENLYWADPYAAGAVLQAAEEWAAQEAARAEAQYGDQVEAHLAGGCLACVLPDCGEVAPPVSLTVNQVAL